MHYRPPQSNFRGGHVPRVPRGIYAYEFSKTSAKCSPVTTGDSTTAVGRSDALKLSSQHRTTTAVCLRCAKSVVSFTMTENTAAKFACIRKLQGGHMPHTWRRHCCRLQRSYALLRRLKFSAIFLRHLVPWPSIDIHRKFYGDRPRGIPPPGELNTRGVVNSHFGLIEGYISETVQDTR